MTDTFVKTEYSLVKPSAKFGDLSDEEYADFAILLDLWQSKRSRNALRMKYYDGKVSAKNLGISIPPSLDRVKVSVGWPAKAVNALAARSVFEGFVSGEAEPKALNAALADNAFEELYTETVQDELIHSCAFFTVTKGDVGEPEVIVSSYSAEKASALWDGRKKRIKCGMAVTGVNDKPGEVGEVNEFVMFTDDNVIRIGYDRGKWSAERAPHTMGRPLMEPMVFKRSSDRPFGRSRINRAVMSITDDALRFRVLMAIASEFYVAPQRYLLGAEEKLFAEESKWQAYIGNIFAISRDEDGGIPEIGQFPQMTMQPLVDYMRQLAASFAGETNIPVSYLGVIHDNPASAEAMYAASEELIIEAQALNRANGAALRNIGLMTTAILEGVSLAGLTTEQKAILPRFRNPEQPFVVSSSDAIVKQTTAIPWIAETRVALEKLGYAEDEIVRMQADKRRGQGSALLARLEAAVQGAGTPPMPEEAKVEGPSDAGPEGV